MAVRLVCNIYVRDLAHHPFLDIFRSLDGGATWSRLWSWAAYPTMSRYYSYDVSLAPWIGVTSADETKQIGWMMEGLSIDPFDSNHWLYGTGMLKHEHPLHLIINSKN